MKRNRGCIIGCVLLFCMALLAVLNLLVGAVSIPPSEVFAILGGHSDGKESWRFIVMESRLPQMLTAILCGGGLAASGLLLQTTFRNPLAGPDVFGVNSGAGLGVSIVMLAMGGSVATEFFSVSGFMAVLLAAFVGAMAVTGLISFFSTLVRDRVLLLIIGVMVGYLASSVISLLNFMATEEGVKSYMVWGMGTFGGVSMRLLPAFALCTVLPLLAALLMVKPLNGLLLGEQYAENLGINTHCSRNILLALSGLLTAVSTAFCGPVAFIGLAVPHVARLLLRTTDHRWLLPTTIVLGSVVALFCNMVCFLPGRNGVVPLNAVTSLVGAPVIIYILLRRR